MIPGQDGGYFRRVDLAWSEGFFFVFYWLLPLPSKCFARFLLIVGLKLKVPFSTNVNNVRVQEIAATPSLWPPWYIFINVCKSKQYVMYHIFINVCKSKQYVMYYCYTKILGDPYKHLKLSAPLSFCNFLSVLLHSVLKKYIVYIVYSCIHLKYVSY